MQGSDNVGGTTSTGDAVQSDRLCEQTTAGEEGNRQPVAAELRAKQPSPDPKAPGMRALTLLSSVRAAFLPLFCSHVFFSIRSLLSSYYCL